MIPALLTMADFYGTLAAVRALGRARLPVAVATSQHLAAASWSRYTTRRLSCPRVEDTDAFIDWLCKLGTGNVRYALLATSDDTAWLFSRHQAKLKDLFYIRQPSTEVVYGLLNKRQLHDHCNAAGVLVPRSWFPSNDAELEVCVREAAGAVLIKPCSQILFGSRNKGEFVENPNEIAAAFRHFSRLKHAPTLVATDKDASLPMVQEFYAEAERGIYNLTGYAGEDGEVWALRAGRKVLQRPRRIGVGLCFESASIDKRGAEAIERLVKRTGFFGVFEAEFIATKRDLLLIDFNPRFYNQMAFDEDRGLPLALLAYYTALGDNDALSRIRKGLRQQPSNAHRVFSHRVTLELQLAIQAFVGAGSRREAKAWREWCRRNREHASDAVLDADDLIPSLADTANHLRHYIRHPRSSYNWLFDR